MVICFHFFKRRGGGIYEKKIFENRVSIVLKIYFYPFDTVGKYEIVINSLNKLLINSYKFRNKHRVVFFFCLKNHFSTPGKTFLWAVDLYCELCGILCNSYHQ